MYLLLAGYLVVAIMAIPYIAEVLRQVPLQVRVMAAMPEAQFKTLKPVSQGRPHDVGDQ